MKSGDAITIESDEELNPFDEAGLKIRKKVHHKPFFTHNFGLFIMNFSYTFETLF